MTEKTLQIEITKLLPGVEDQQDGCLERLEKTLSGYQGICRAHLEPAPARLDLCLHYDPRQLSAVQVQMLAEKAGHEIVQRYHHQNLQLEGMDCSDCARLVEHRLERLDGVLNASVDYASSTLRVEYDSKRIRRGSIERRIRQLGYVLPAHGFAAWLQANRELLFSLLAGVALLAGWLGGRFFEFPPAISLGLYVSAYLLGGYDIARHALPELIKERKLDTHLLMLLAALGAASLGDWPEGALLLFLFSLGHALEERMLDRAHSAVRALGALAPKTALVRRSGQEVHVPVDRIAIGETVIVPPGVRLPVDGEIIAGVSAVNQAPVTGESLPVEKAAGDKVFAGTINGNGALDVRATRLARDSTLARVMQMVADAQAQQSPTQQLTERVMRWFVPAVLVADLLLIIVPPMVGVPWRVSFLRAMTFLVAVSPCALALGTPAAIIAGIAQAARHGVLLKGGVHLENLGRLRALAFDKTGTLTEGVPQVASVVALNSLPAASVLALAASLEARSAHPLAAAVLRRAAADQVDIPAAEQVTGHTGQGLVGRVIGKATHLGSARFMESEGYLVSLESRKVMEELESQGQTAVLVGQAGQLIGVMAFSDTLRPGVPAALGALKQLGVTELVMLSGDNQPAAEAIGRQAGIRQVRGSLLPEDKLAVIGELRERCGLVGMVGDGINDAPALAHATLGIAMGGASTDVALETADIALMAPDMSRLPFAVGLGRAAQQVIRQNLAIAGGVIVLLAGLVLTGTAGIGLTVLIHEGSTLLVALNAMRLLSFEGK